MITKDDIEAMSTDELNEYSKQQIACADFINALLPMDVAPHKIATTIRKAFIAGWVAKDKEQSHG